MKLSSTLWHGFVHPKETSSKKLKQSKKGVKWPEQDFIILKQKCHSEKESGKRAIESKIWNIIRQVRGTIKWEHSIWSLACECIYFDCKKKGEERWKFSVWHLYTWLQKSKHINSAELHIMLSEIRVQERMEYCNMRVPHPDPASCWESCAGHGGCAAKGQCYTEWVCWHLWRSSGITSCSLSCPDELGQSATKWPNTSSDCRNSQKIRWVSRQQDFICVTLFI